MTYTSRQSQNAEAEETVANSEAVSLNTLAPLDTICVQTRNNSYRIFLLDPTSGQAMIEGGHFTEPVEAWLCGSATGCTFNFGTIGVGMRLEFWTDDRHISTSPVQAFHIENHAVIEPVVVN